MSHDERSILYRAARDPFARTAPLDEAATFPVLGIPLQVRSNAPEAIALAEAAFGAWRRLDPALIERTPVDPGQARLDIVVHADGSDEPPPASLVLRRHGPVFVAGGGANLFVTLLDRRHAIAFVTPAGLADPIWADWHVLAWGRFAVSLVDRVPFHAAGVLVGDTAVLVAGPSGIGKSTLCYACARAGLRVLAEEVVHVSLEGGLRLWGYASRIALNPDVVRWFPELAGVDPIVRPNAKRRLLVPLPAAANEPALTHRGPIVICRLERGDGDDDTLEPMSRPHDPGDLFAAEPGFDQMPDAFPAAADALLGHPLCSLRMSGDPTRTVARIRAAAQLAANPRHANAW